MSAALAAAQAVALASLASDGGASPSASSVGVGASPMSVSSFGVGVSSPSHHHVTGLDLTSHSALFAHHPPGLPTTRANMQPTDYSAIMMEEWIQQYMKERSNFTSVSLFCEIKLRELIELTTTLHLGVSDDSNPDSSRSIPSKLRTAVCIDLLDILIASVIQPEMGQTTQNMKQQQQPPNTQSTHSRQALGHLLLRLRDEIIKSIYIQPVPAHLFLQYMPYFSKPQLHSSAQRRSLPGSLTQRGRHAKMEEKFEEKQQLGSLTHRGRLVSQPRTAASGGILTGPPCCIDEFLKCTEWFSLIPQHVARNRHLAEQARIIMIPSKLFRLRQIQKKVVGNMTSKWRELLLKWKFWEWREIVRQKKVDKKHDRASKVVHRLTNSMMLLSAKLHFLHWRQIVVYRKYRMMRDAKQKGLSSNAELIEETFRLSEETHALRDQIARLDTSNAALTLELKTLRARLEHSQVDLQDTSKHQQQCSELLEALRGPLKTVFNAIGSQLDSFAGREFISVHPLISTIVDSEYQTALEPLGMPTLVGMEQWGMLGSLTSGTPKQRIAICAEIVARWLALQLKLCSTVLSGGSGQYSEYLVKLDNQQRLAAALARIRQLCSANPPTTLPPFPIVKRAITTGRGSGGHATPAGGASTPATPGLAGGGLPGMGGLPLTRARQRNVGMPTPGAIAAAVANNESPATSKEKDVDDDDSKSTPRPAPRSGRMGLKKLSMAGKVEELPPAPPGSDLHNKNRRLQEGQAIPSGTLSTPIRVFAQLRDTDRPETIFSIAAVMMHADGEVARSLKLPSDKRWTDDERSKVTALRSLMDSLRVTPDMQVSAMDGAVATARDGIDATHTALSRARSAQAKMQAIEDEVFAQSVKLLHQQSQRKHRHGERENNMPTDLLDVDLSLFTDVLDSNQISKLELTETNRVLEEYCRDLYKIFSYYCHPPASSAALMLSNATQGEPRMGNTEFWRFVRECKLKLQQTGLIDLVFVRAADRSPLDGSDGPIGSSVGSSSSGPTSTANLIASMQDGMSLAESEAIAERARHAESGNKDIGFKQFGEAIIRLSLIKYPNEKNLARKLKNLLISHVLPNSSAKALAFHKQQLSAAQSVAAASTGSAATNTPGVHANFNTLEVDSVFRKYNVLLRQIFQIYARITPNFMTMTFNDFLGFAREFELLHKYVTQHDLKQLFSNVIRDMPSGSGSGDAEVTNLTGGGINMAGSTQPAGANSNTPMDKAGDDDASGNAPAKELSYKQFLELLAAVSFYVVRNPYYALHDRVERFISSVLASRKKLPQKTFRSAI